jgi:hypothetical protein
LNDLVKTPSSLHSCFIVVSNNETLVPGNHLFQQLGGMTGIPDFD